MSEDGARIIAIELDEKSIVRWKPEIEHERNVAVFDLLEGNSFKITDFPGPYRVLLSLRENRLVFLCWKRGEKTIEYYHHLEDGFPGRQPIPEEELAR